VISGNVLPLQSPFFDLEGQQLYYFCQGNVQREMIILKGFIPARLSGAKKLGFFEICQVLVIGPDQERVARSQKEVSKCLTA